MLRTAFASGFIALIFVSLSLQVLAVTAPPPPLFLPALSNSSGGNTPQSVAIADLNADGVVDLVVGNLSSLAIFVGRGDGTFQSPIVYDIGYTDAQYVAVADLNGDTAPDLVVAHCGQRGGDECQSLAFVSVWLGNGDGTFQTGVRYDSGGYGAMSVAVGDLNKDGKVDVVVSNNSADGLTGGGNVAVLLGNGNGTLQKAVAYDSGGQSAYTVALKDVNGDGKLDVIVAGQCTPDPAVGCVGHGLVGVLLGNGDGSFKHVVTVESGAYDTTALKVADLNGDGYFDVVTYSGCGNFPCGNSVLGVLIGRGDGTFQPAVLYDSRGWQSLAWLDIADVNGDGKPDVLAANSTGTGSGQVAVLLGNGDATLQTAMVYDTGGSSPIAIAVADLNHDHLPDVALTQCSITGCDNGDLVGVLLHVGSVETATTISSFTNPSPYGKLITMTAEVQSAAGIPAGSVKFFDGSSELGSATLLDGIASIPTKILQVGSRPITAVYQGSLKFQSSSSSTLTQSVYRVSTSTGISSSYNPAFVNQSISYTASIVSKFGGAVTGFVVFSINGASQVTLPMVGGKAIWSTHFASSGTHMVTASYLGDVNTFGSTATALSQSVVMRTAMTLSATPDPSFVNQPVQFLATAKALVGQIPDGEIITFSSGTKIYGTAPLVAGKASLITATIPAGSSFIRASYGGSDVYSANYASIKQVVQRYPTTTAITANVNPSTIGQPVTFTAIVTSSSATVPTGWVTFRDGTKMLGTRLLSGGKADFTTFSLSAGTHSISVSYSITPTWTGSKSTVLNQVVQ